MVSRRDRETIRHSDSPSSANHTPVLFDESFFPAPDELQASYGAQVHAGYRRMKQHRVVIAGLARDVSWILDQTLARITRLGQLFSDYRVVLYENDSQDDTLARLQAWSQRDARHHLLHEALGDPVNPPRRCLDRATRMAKYRRKCQHFIREKFPRYDYVILVDTDVAGGWSFDGVAHTFGTDLPWDFVGSNGVILRRIGWSPNRIFHYDAWAYRTDADLVPLPTKVANRFHFHRGESLVPVTSCFGGLGIYQMEAYRAGHYDGADMEHANFHRSLIQAGMSRLYLNPSQIVLYGRKRRRNDRWMQPLIRFWQRITFQTVTPWYFEGPNGQTDLPSTASNWLEAA